MKAPWVCSECGCYIRYYPTLWTTDVAPDEKTKIMLVGNVCPRCDRQFWTPMANWIHFEEGDIGEFELWNNLYEEYNMLKPYYGSYKSMRSLYYNSFDK
mgnify:CR=1 FL=1